MNVTKFHNDCECMFQVTGVSKISWAVAQVITSIYVALEQRDRVACCESPPTNCFVLSILEWRIHPLCWMLSLQKNSKNLTYVDKYFWPTYPRITFLRIDVSWKWIHMLRSYIWTSYSNPKVVCSSNASMYVTKFHNDCECMFPVTGISKISWAVAQIITAIYVALSQRDRVACCESPPTNCFVLSILEWRIHPLCWMLSLQKNSKNLTYVDKYFWPTYPWITFFKDRCELKMNTHA